MQRPYEFYDFVKGQDLCSSESGYTEKLTDILCGHISWHRMGSYNHSALLLCILYLGREEVKLTTITIMIIASSMLTK